MDRGFSEGQADRAAANRNVNEDEDIYKLPSYRRLNLTKDIQLRNFDRSGVRACNATLDGKGLPVALEMLGRESLPPESVLCFETKRQPLPSSQTQWYLRLYDMHPIAREARLLQSVTLRGADQMASALTTGSTLIGGGYLEADGYWNRRSFATISLPKAEYFVPGRQGKLFYKAEFNEVWVELQFAYLGHISKIYFDLGALDFLSLNP